MAAYSTGKCEAGPPCTKFCVRGKFLVGRLLDHDYQKTAKRYHIAINHLSGDDMSTFPIEEARLRSSWFPALIGILAVIGYGWALQTTTVSVCLIEYAFKKC